MPHHPAHPPFLYGLNRKHVSRGVLLDIPGLIGWDVLPKDFVITPEHMDAAGGAGVRTGDIVLIRTGWGQYRDDAGRGAVLSARGVFAAGSDTALFEFTPGREIAVHVHLLVESGIHIIECLNPEDLAAAGAREFVFVAAPLKIRGGTGSPIRAVALLERTVGENDA